MSNSQVNFVNKKLQEGFPIPSIADTKDNFVYLFSILDKKTGLYLPPFVSESIAEGLRQFESLVNYSGSLICNFPEDYKLVYIGLFDKCLGSLTSPEKLLSWEGSLLKRSDALRYKNLLKDCKETLAKATTAIADFEKFKTDLKSSVELFPINKSKEEPIVYPRSKTRGIKRILDTLFGSY